MKIITGNLKGRKLKVKKVMDYRPSTGKFKEALFSILQAQKFQDERMDNFFEDKIVYDIFAGSGIYAFEAISRGAKKAYAIDIDKENINFIKENAARFNIADKIVALSSDVLTLGGKSLVAADVIFMDPPYYEDLITASLKVLGPILKKDTIVVIESAFNHDFKHENYELLIKKVYGKNNKLSILRPL